MAQRHRPPRSRTALALAVAALMQPVQAQDATPASADAQVNAGAAAAVAPQTPEGAPAPATTASASDATPPGRAEATAAAAALASPPVAATRLEPVIVTATRSREAVSTVPAAVTIVTREQIAEQSRTASNLGEVLGKLVPGMAVGSGTQTNYNQSLRGRALLVLIDGVPQTTVRNVARDLRTIDPAMVERVEVVRGPTAMYGHGASGGVVNIITKAPAEGQWTHTREIGFSTSLTHIDDDSVGGWLREGIGLRKGAFDFSAQGSVERIPSFFDAHGHRIAPEPAQGDLSDTDQYGLFGKMGWTGQRQRLEFTANRFRARQDSDYISDPSVNAAPPGSVRARTLRGLDLEKDPYSENDVFNLSYRHDAVGNSSLESQLYYRDYLTRFYPFDGRAVAGYTGRQVVSSYLDSNVRGGRLAMDTPLVEGENSRLSVLWGVDYALEDTEQRITVFDRATYDNSGGRRYVATDDRSWVPPIDHEQLGLFAQLEWQPIERLTLRGGARQEFIKVEVNDFQNLGSGATVRGGKVDYDDIAYNAGATVQATQRLSVYANYAEGFSLPDVGLILRDAAADFQVGRTSLEPLAVKNYELGLRHNGERVSSTASVYYSKSEQGFFSGGRNQPVQRAPERTYGLELTTEAGITDSLTAGGSLSWGEGEYHDAIRDRYVALNGWRISPAKLTAYVEHETAGGWRNRLQGLYSGNRDDAFEETPGNPNITFGRWEVEDYVVFDWQSSLSLGRNTLSVGVENLFNDDYYNVFSQLLYSGNVSHFKAPGRTLRVGYAWSF